MRSHILLRGGLKSRRTWLAIKLLVPLFICYALIVVYPFIKVIQLSLTDYNPLYPRITYVWWGNFQQLIFEPRFRQVIINTLIWTVGIIVAEFVFGLAVALLLNQQFKGRGTYRTLILIPWVVPPICAALTFNLIYDPYYGPVNWLLQTIHVIDRPIAWLAETHLVLFACMLMRIWRGVPFVIIALLAGLQAIPSGIYEAARIDGAGWVKRLFRITLPLIMPIALVTILLVTIWTFNAFAEVFVLTKGGPGYSSMLISLYGFKTAFEFYKLGYGAAIGVSMFLLMLFPIYLYLRHIRK